MVASFSRFPLLITKLDATSMRILCLNEMMPEHARWFAGSAEGLADADAAAERLQRAEGPRGRRLGVRVRHVARKGWFAPPGLAGSGATAGRHAGS